MHRFLSGCLLCLAVTACSWVSVERGAEDVLVLPEERLTPDCASLGKVTVSVVDKVGVLERHDEEVIEDLDILARNHAAKAGGDTVVPISAPADGKRRYEVWRCTEAGREQGQEQAREETRPNDNVEVLPYEGG